MQSTSVQPQQSLLKPATVEQAAAKLGIFGPQGCGKSTTAVLLLIGLSKYFHNAAPIAYMDTEASGSDPLIEIFETEGVPLLRFKSRAFTDMRQGIADARRERCCGYLVDSYTHPWKELNDSLKKKLNVTELQFRHMDELKSIWQTWTDAMLNSPLHVILSGRLGYVWDKEEDETGKKTNLIKLGTKMKSESEAGYEPSLLIEMEAIQEEGARMRQSRTKKGSIVHHAYVLKDRWRTLNGLTFTWKDLNKYKKGDYEKVFKPFLPHFSKLAIGKPQGGLDSTRTSEELFDHRGDSAYQHRAKRVQVTLEEIEGTLVALWPGQDAKSKELKRVAVETLFHTRSWTAVESLKLEELEIALAALRLFEESVKAGNDRIITDKDLAFEFLEQFHTRIVESGTEPIEKQIEFEGMQVS